MDSLVKISYLLLIPLLGSILLLFIDKTKEKLIKIISIVVSLIAFIYSLLFYFKFDSQAVKYQFVETYQWFSLLNISYLVALDGISLLLVLLTTFITPLALFSSWDSIKKDIKLYNFFMLLLEFSMLGVFVSMDLFLFYIYWELMLIPMYFIIGIWGGDNRIYAAIKFFLYTMFGSLIMLVAIIWLGVKASEYIGYFTTNYFMLQQVGYQIPLNIQAFLFFAFLLSFAIKVPVFPLHTWLPDAHVQAPTAGSVILAGVLLKMGTYGILRFCLPLFPQSAIKYAPFIAILAVIGIIYGALVSIVQKDMKKLVAYSSVSHLGFVVLGIFAMTYTAVQGSVIQMINHGLSTGALFLLVGFIYDRTHTREIEKYGGIAKIVPVYSTILLIVSLSSIGVPGLNGFIGEFLILLGSFKSSIYNSWWFAAISTTGIIFAAVYLLWMYQRVVLGEVKHENLFKLTDLNARELVVIIPIVLFIVWIGVYPNTFLSLTEVSVKNIIDFTISFK
ncbi:MAG TPA: NADH-quinone oxidoreductase subunit M [Ignavibacteriales bacterium]|nr:NADH-quinone oxidoreductase subunit M [Ignavibacteriales bacterium]HOL80768.1 NADH-quinone oxidoreductase subunit M [Ignavibacteriales bacterium]HOM66014.1 NADH-quinone oxidoreductase subunit M [Ignavibacteriales bacterium]HPD68359.1 NADH-quinone oxidoreductase subunit M [Ignavibacteriales bacterium]HPP33204.1 NADH-quinone oxidoreductase subunit M [Ignavibacteriales bacterium]